MDKERGAQYLIQLRKQIVICKTLAASARDVSINDGGRSPTAVGWE